MFWQNNFAQWKGPLPRRSPGDFCRTLVKCRTNCFNSRRYHKMTDGRPRKPSSRSRSAGSSSDPRTKLWKTKFINWRLALPRRGLWAGEILFRGRRLSLTEKWPPFPNNYGGRGEGNGHFWKSPLESVFFSLVVIHLLRIRLHLWKFPGEFSGAGVRVMAFASNGHLFRTTFNVLRR